MRTNQRAGNEADRRFPVRIRIGIPPGRLGNRLDQMSVWLDQNCGADGWAITPSGSRGVVNDALAIYFADAALAGAFVARWCAASGSRLSMGCSWSGMTSRRQGSEQVCTERLEWEDRPSAGARQRKCKTVLLVF